MGAIVEIWSEIANFLGMDPTTFLIFILLSVAYLVVTLKSIRRYGSSFEERFRVASAAAAIWLAIFGGWQFLDQRQREVQREFDEKQMNLCLEAAESAAIVASSYNPDIKLDDPVVIKAQTRFQALYYGSLAVVEDEGVAHSMVVFHDDVRQYHWGRLAEDSKEMRSEKARTKNLNQDQLLLAEAIDIAGACRDLAQSHWQIKILSKSVKELLKEHVGQSPPDPNSGPADAKKNAG